MQLLDGKREPESLELKDLQRWSVFEKAIEYRHLLLSGRSGFDVNVYPVEVCTIKFEGGEDLIQCPRGGKELNCLDALDVW